jgi:flagellar biosynthesis anti-sigma factor FlgM
MRIDLYNSIASELASEQASQKAGTESAKSSVAGADAEDRATLSSGSTSVSSLVSTALNTPPVRQGLVDSLKSAVSNGTYDLNPHSIAASMVDDHA